MQKYDAVEKGIANNDVKALREAIGSICYTNRDFSNSEFFEVVRYVESNGIKLKDDTLVGAEPVSKIKTEFDEDDFTRAVFELKRNFCDERIKDVETIGKKLYGKKDIQKENTTSRVINQRQERSLKRETVNRNVDNGEFPNAQSHQPNNTVKIVIGVVAIAAMIVIILYIGSSLVRI
ncbi:hypothetical protein EHW90_10325 [Lachnoanaerobaculum orale]|uniref:Uncharacterized protein n=1 Tax=Lachnoanaerobaculum orale TaxID=979627 RepID=A0A3P3PZ59_9FIRM|nr:hypothetical protein [Lachnoanaerobaculum orale]RRJ14094.1 hypothetical protein EHW90_10325 [Lachnoanaerobaculum orale]